MTKLYIQVVEGNCINHPAYASNLIEAFGEIPPNWEPFIRVKRPTLGIYEILEDEQPLYKKVNGVWTDVWFVRNMTTSEKRALQQEVKTSFASRLYASNWASWTFDEESCSMVPPIPRPAPDEQKLNQGIRTFWCGAENNWKDTPPYPQDGKQYQFDFFAWKWV